jgi:hypothetical protein
MQVMWFLQNRDSIRVGRREQPLLDGPAFVPVGKPDDDVRPDFRREPEEVATHGDKHNVRDPIRRPTAATLSGTTRPYSIVQPRQRARTGAFSNSVKAAEAMRVCRVLLAVHVFVCCRDSCDQCSLFFLCFSCQQRPFRSPFIFQTAREDTSLFTTTERGASCVGRGTLFFLACRIVARF